MPLFEYLCRTCARRFEALVMGTARPRCPGCDGNELEKQFSTFAVKSGGGRFADGASSGVAEDFSSGSCGSCGDPRGPGSCGLD